MNFNSFVCTTREQSQRLLELGLKPETADMELVYNIFSKTYEPLPKAFPAANKCEILAWSLHRLIEILPSGISKIDCYYGLTFDKDIIQYEDYGIDVLKSFGDNPCLYDNIIDCIEWLIKEDYFNKEYLKQ